MTKDTMTEEEPMVTDKERREAARELRGYGFDVLKDGSLLSTLKDVTGELLARLPHRPGRPHRTAGAHVRQHPHTLRRSWL